MDEAGDTTPRVVEKLDVEDEEDRQARIQSYLEKLNASSQTRNFTRPSGIPEFKFDFGDRTTFPVVPNTELLSRVQAFLPQLEASNAILTQRAQEDPSSVDIEHIPEGMDQYIEMNLGLGVFEDRSHIANQGDEDSEMSTSSSSSSESSDKARDNDDDDDSDADSDESSEIITSFVPSRPIKPLPRRASTKPNPGIVVLDEQPQSQS
ncbi:hypothetical protein JR316_0005702 [Psilocybe cubensis]|uniref:Uncharacterized protein n=2 Tax=Psilocybe cubensis TaxID=181762 RepID=A0A8H7XXV0_PSICU|nr:hypothetical protein JR316_0005702 [Psilocybe cubensis]KAH9481182.1 hypothetical protein JR316_0005702 [Psilocybe cubensis]